MGKNNGGKSGSEESREDRAIEAIGRLPENLAILRMENENIVAMAKATPRDHKSIIAEITAQLDAYPAFAQVALYAKPVGKDLNGQMKIARGLSIRAAEAIAEAYRYNRVQAIVSPTDDPDAVRVAAMFVDYQNGRIWQDEGILSKWYKKRTGEMQKHPDDRFFNVVVKAEVSRRIREVVLRSVPPGLRQELMDMAQKAVAKLLTEDKVKSIITAFKEKNVTQEQLERYIGRPISLGWREEDRLNLQGLYVAIEDGETTVEEAFGEEKPKASSQGEGQVAALVAGTQQPQAAAATPQPAASAPPATPSGGSPGLEDLEEPDDEKTKNEQMTKLVHATIADKELFPDGAVPAKVMQNLLLRAYGVPLWTEVTKLSIEKLEKGTDEKHRGLAQIREDIAEYKRRKAEKKSVG